MIYSTELGAARVRFGASCWRMRGRVTDRRLLGSQFIYSAIWVMDLLVCIMGHPVRCWKEKAAVLVWY